MTAPRTPDGRLPGVATDRRADYNAGVISEARLERYRNMTPEERWGEVEELMTLAWRGLLELPDEERNRRLQVIRDEHEAGNRILLEHLRRLD